MSGAPPPLDAGALVGLLADEDRRRVVAALVLDASRFDAVVSVSGLGPAAAGRALARMADAGLVERAPDGALAVMGSAFAAAARAAARQRPGPERPTHADPEVARVLRAYVADGRLLQIPSVRSKRRVVLELLAGEFEPGRRYPEPEVNAVLGRWHDDRAALRRYLVDEGFLDRADGKYWRCGGQFDHESAPAGEGRRR